MSLWVGSASLKSVSADMLRESLLEDIGMLFIWSSAPPTDGSTSLGEPESFSPQGQKQTLPYDATLNACLTFECCMVSYLLHRPG